MNRPVSVQLLSDSFPAGLSSKQIGDDDEAHYSVAAERLWLCIYLPCLAVDALPCNAEKPVVVTEQHNSRIVIHACNRIARDSGIAPGMLLSSAVVLCQTLAAFPRQCIVEQGRLNRLAALTFDFSNTVSLYTVDSVVLEIKGSLRLFGGLHKLIRSLSRRLDDFGGESIVTIAPTARAAFWLAQCNFACVIDRIGDLALMLRDLPISVLSTDQRCLTRLSRGGITTVSDILRLPRDGLARRFGSSLMENLDIALAKQPETVNLFKPPELFSASVELYRPSDKLEHLTYAASTLLQQLQSFLVERQAATRHIQCVFGHSSDSDTVVDVGSNFYIQQAERFTSLLEEHLKQTRLPAEVLEITVVCKRIDVFFPEQLDLFDNAAADEHVWHQLVESFQARLGDDALQSLTLHPDHRPEKAGRVRVTPVTVENTSPTPRPLWLLPSPQSIKASLQQLYWNGPLSLSPEVECIEQGWWDGDDIRRNYRIARNTDGSHLWLFQDLRSQKWFLHGLFG